MHVAGWCSGHGVGLLIERSRVRLPAISLSSDNSGQVEHTHSACDVQQKAIISHWPNGGDALRLGL